MRSLQFYTEAWNADNIYLQRFGYPIVPNLTLLEPTLTNVINNYYVKPRTLNASDRLVDGAKQIYEKLQKSCGANPSIVAQSVVQILKTPFAQFKPRYIVNRPDNCFDITLQQLISASNTIDIGVTNAVSCNYYKSIFPKPTFTV